MSEEREQRQAPNEMQPLQGRIDQQWQEVLRALDGIPEERLEEPGVCGAWSAKNLMGHLAFWNDHVLGEIDRALAGHPEEDVDFQALNDVDQAERAGRTLTEEREAMHRAHAAVVARLAGATGSDAVRLDQAVGRHTYEHYAAHARDIRRWRHRVGI
jgi:hypothetical protein